MTTEEFDAIKIREFLKTLTPEEIADSVHLIGIDFDTCEIDEVVGATWTLFLEYQYLKRQISHYNQMSFIPEPLVDSTSKLRDNFAICKSITKKILSCKQLEELVIERAINDYFEQNNKGMTIN